MRTIVGMFSLRDDAHAAVKDLIDHGFDPAEVSLIQRSSTNGHTPAASADEDAHMRRSMAVGGVAGLLAGASVFFIPGIGPIVALGGLVATAVGGVGGAFLGNLVGAITAWGVSEDTAERYVEHVRTGGTLVAVRTDDARIADAESILRGHGSAGIDFPQGAIERPGEFGELPAQ